MEYATNRSLFEFLKSEKTKIDLYKKSKICLDICKGLLHLHELDIIHRDLKSLNILLNKNLNAKITDFGISKFFQSNYENLKSKLENNYSNTTLSGSLPWKAPEVYENKTVFESDIYSLGIIFWEIIHEKIPFMDLQYDEIKEKIVNKKERLSIDNSCPLLFKNLITKCWLHEPKERPNLKYIQLEIKNFIYLLKAKKSFNSKIYIKTFYYLNKISNLNNYPEINEIYFKLYLNGLGVEKNYQKAFDFLLKNHQNDTSNFELKYFEKINESKKSEIYFELGNFYYSLNNFKKSIYYYFKSLENRNKNAEIRLLELENCNNNEILFEIGLNYYHVEFNSHVFTKSLELFEKSLKYGNILAKSRINEIENIKLKNSEKIQIFLRSADGKSFLFQVLPDEKVSELKKKYLKKHM